jgi:hypothetical protein
VQRSTMKTSPVPPRPHAPTFVVHSRRTACMLGRPRRILVVRCATVWRWRTAFFLTPPPVLAERPRRRPPGSPACQMRTRTVRGEMKREPREAKVECTKIEWRMQHRHSPLAIRPSNESGAVPATVSRARPATMPPPARAHAASSRLARTPVRHCDAPAAVPSASSEAARGPSWEDAGPSRGAGRGAVVDLSRLCAVWATSAPWCSASQETCRRRRSPSRALA